MKRIKIKKLILHIGSHKAGSTYIQKYFKENKCIVNHKKHLYPKSGCDSLYGHHEIYETIKTKSDNIEYILESMLKEQLPSHEAIFLSSENFEYFNLNEITELINYFDFEKIEVIYLYRSWTPLLYSMWQEEIKHGAVVAFECYCLRHIGFPMSSELLNYSITLDNYEKAVGRENISIASYDILKNIDLVDFVSSLIGIEGRAKPVKREQVNSSFDPCLVEIIRVMNEFALRENYSKSYLPKHLYINKASSGRIGKNRDKRIREAMSPYLSHGFDYSQSFSFKHVYNQFFSKYSSCFVDGVSDKESFLQLKYKASTIVSSGYLLDEKVLADLHSAWVDVRSGMPK